MARQKTHSGLGPRCILCMLTVQMAQVVYAAFDIASQQSMRFTMRAGRCRS
ncbi:hypothetical protein MLPF_0402 [Mycobacterium lepromatosis]|nr:hypothetical protein MLPF_0402 [Mycobacterium lepromatosis]